MFLQLAGIIPGGALKLFQCHPFVLNTLLEVAWQSRAQPHPEQPLDLGHPGHKSDIGQLPDFWLNPLKTVAGIEAPTGLAAIWTTDDTKKLGTVLWDHLIYAYMIENTRVYEIFRRVLYEFLYGEKLGVPTPEAQYWLRNTEELFYRDPMPYTITAISSDIRPDRNATRRNAYWRLFGMDLNHGTDEGLPYSYFKASAYNKEFVSVFEELLREVWIAITNVKNQSGTNQTDAPKMGNLVDTLQYMLMARRESGNLAREEFAAVATMSWFHLTISFDSPIITALRAEAASPEQRLFKVAQRVGLPAHGLSKSYFDIAHVISRILTLIEANGRAIVPGLLVEGALQDAFSTSITYWNDITGHDVKAGKVAVR